MAARSAMSGSRSPRRCDAAPMSSRLLLACLGLALGSLVLVVFLVLGIRLLTLETPGPPPRTQEPYYEIRRGDALSAIAQKTGVPVEELRALNPALDPLALVPGRRIRLRASAAPPSAADHGRGRRRVPRRPYHIVKPGDALERISARTGVPVSRLIELNRGIKPDALVPGQRIRLRPSRRPLRLPPIFTDTD